MFYKLFKIFQKSFMSTFLLNVPSNRNFGDAIAVQDLRGIHIWNSVRGSPRTKILEPLLKRWPASRAGPKMPKRAEICLMGRLIITEYLHSNLYWVFCHRFVIQWTWLHVLHTVHQGLPDLVGSRPKNLGLKTTKGPNSKF